jgi:hypothetical protein
MKNFLYHEIFYPAPIVVSPTHKKRWDTVAYNLELIGLQKEVLHLEYKSKERALTEWEVERLHQVRDQLASITQ